jgi:hypothetical protein
MVLRVKGVWLGKRRTLSVRQHRVGAGLGVSAQQFGHVEHLLRHLDQFLVFVHCRFA